MNITYLYTLIEKLKKTLLINPVKTVNLIKTVTAGTVSFDTINNFMVSGYLTRIKINLNTSPAYGFRIWADSTKTKLVYAAGLNVHISGVAKFDDQNVFEFHNQDSQLTNKIYIEIINKFNNSADADFNITLEGKQ